MKLSMPIIPVASFEEPEAKDPCFMCGDDMSKPEVGMVEAGPNGTYICTQCYSGKIDATYEMMKDRGDDAETD